MSDLIYLDNNATTQPLPEVVEAMLPLLVEQYANPSSVHQFGQGVRHRVETARTQVADLISASPKEIVFTSGGTESINMAIRGALRLYPDRHQIVTSAVEHSAGLRVMEQLEREGYVIHYVGVDGDGQLKHDEWDAKLNDETALATFLHANNETGVLFDVARMARAAADRGIPVHVDAIQTAGKLELDISSWPVQFVSLSAHKFHGPKGVGALYVRRRTRLTPLILGGGQERRLRGGTENVAGIVGMGAAAVASKLSGVGSRRAIGQLRDRFEAEMLERVPYARINGHATNRMFNTSNIGFAELGAEGILILLSEAGICASAGSACSSGSLEPSHVLEAMGIEERIAHGSIRFSLSRFTTEEEITRAVDCIPKLLERLKTH